MNRAKLYYLREKVGKKARVRAEQYGGSSSADVDEPSRKHAERAREARVPSDAESPTPTKAVAPPRRAGAEPKPAEPAAEAGPEEAS